MARGIAINTILGKYVYRCETRYADFIGLYGKPHLNSNGPFESSSKFPAHPATKDILLSDGIGIHKRGMHLKHKML